MKKQLYILCGIPGSGKSTWIKNHLAQFEHLVAVVSRDDIRFMLVPEGEEYFSREIEVYNKFIDDIKFGLYNAEIVVADATHLNEGSRGKLLRRLGDSIKDVEIIAMVVRPPVNVSLDQNELRKGTRSYVPKSVIRRMDSQFVMPTKAEGFDKIYIYNPTAEGAKYTILEED